MMKLSRLRWVSSRSFPQSNPIPQWPRTMLIRILCWTTTSARTLITLHPQRRSIWDLPRSQGSMPHPLNSQSRWGKERSPFEWKGAFSTLLMKTKSPSNPQQMDASQVWICRRASKMPGSWQEFNRKVTHDSDCQGMLKNKNSSSTTSNYPLPNLPLTLKSLRCLLLSIMTLQTWSISYLWHSSVQRRTLSCSNR